MLTDAQIASIWGMIILLAAIIITVSFLLMLTLIETKQLNSVTSKTMFILSASDFLMGAVTLPTCFAVFTLHGKSRSCNEEQAAIFAVNCNGVFSGYMVYLIALHSYARLGENTTTRNKLRKCFTSDKGTLPIVVICAILSMVQGMVSANLFGYNYGSNLIKFVMKSANVIFGSVVSTVYCRMYFKNRFMNVESRRGPKFAPHRITDEDDPETVKDSSKATGYLLLSIALCYLPFFVFDKWILHYEFIEEKLPPQRVQYFFIISWVMANLVSASNGTILMYQHRSLRKYVSSNFLPTRYKARMEYGTLV